MPHGSEPRTLLIDKNDETSTFLGVLIRHNLSYGPHSKGLQKPHLLDECLKESAIPLRAAHHLRREVNRCSSAGGLKSASLEDHWLKWKDMTLLGPYLPCTCRIRRQVSRKRGYGTSRWICSLVQTNQEDTRWRSLRPVMELTDRQEGTHQHSNKCCLWLSCTF